MAAGQSILCAALRRAIETFCLDSYDEEEWILVMDKLRDYITSDCCQDFDAYRTLLGNNISPQMDAALAQYESDAGCTGET